ncbi:methyltransferase [Wenyingzhuangia sp. 2_MG-2023]|uniref:methyltransferase n=1 Tax=Wenyingzhuangia sp. 2_MG-2023 TaxID=3062639 RepID=UPI0026E454AF|nr:methyltransferase [Wenyingzhuangia sp. 2_MG-2023]MDO6737060.1 methyltransferase [Wenyingzhuangia sp. 2_MG-2023]
MEILNTYLKKARRVYTEEVTVNEYQSIYKELKEGEDLIKAELKTKTVKILKSVCYQLGIWSDNRDKKADLINKIYESLSDYLLLNRSVSYFIGEETHETTKEKLIINTTPEVLQNFYKERKAKKEATKKAIENPKTLEEFRTFIRVEGLDKLNIEQVAEFERLKSDVLLKRQEEQKKQEATVNKINIDNVDFDLHPTKHSKTGADIFTVLMLNRVGKEEFNTLRTKAKQMGGYYSRFTNLRADPPIKAGFNFNTEEEAKAFIGLKEEDKNTAEKAEAKDSERQQTAAEKMKERGLKLIEKGTESKNKERRTNTHRQATQAANSEEKAQDEINFGKKLILISDGLESGSIKYLHAIRNGKQLEQLQNLLNIGFSNRLSSLNLTYTEKQNEIKQPYLDVNFIEYPYPKYGSNVLKTIFLKYKDTTGMKKAVKTILDYEARNKTKSELVTFKNESIINTLKTTALKIPDSWDRDRILDSIKSFERIQKMGLTNEAILKTALRELICLTEGAEPTEEEKKATELKAIERSFINKKIDGFFPTPKPLIDRMLSMAKVYENETILEPSAGLGHIAEAIREKYPLNDLSCIEFNYQLSEVLIKKGFEDTENINFLTSTHKYDVIFMNPPFEKHQDIDHVKHAFNLLNTGGRLVAIMAGNKHESSSNKKINEFLQMVEEYGHIQENETGSFKNAFNSTNVNTVTVYLEKS